MGAIAEFLSGDSIYVYIFIFFGKLIEVALSSLRTQLIMKGQRIPGAIISLFEYTFWLSITASAISGFASDPIKVVVLVCAFSAGNVLGSIIEEKMALGFCSISSIFVNKELALSAAELLRNQGYAVTIIPAEGMHGANRTAIMVMVNRKHVVTVRKVICAIDPNAVITVFSTQYQGGGTLSKTMK